MTWHHRVCDEDTACQFNLRPSLNIHPIKNAKKTTPWPEHKVLQHFSGLWILHITHLPHIDLEQSWFMASEDPDKWLLRFLSDSRVGAFHLAVVYSLCHKARGWHGRRPACMLFCWQLATMPEKDNKLAAVLTLVRKKNKNTVGMCLASLASSGPVRAWGTGAASLPATSHTRHTFPQTQKKMKPCSRINS